MSDFKIEKNIPVPEIVRGRGHNGESKYPWKLLEKGDSFFVPGAKRSNFQTQASAWSKKMAPITFTARDFVENVPGGTIKGVRVWRTE